MYDRAPRTYPRSVGCTPDHIGPGSYDHRLKKTSEESYAPFLSLSNRADLFFNEERPGPGHYDIHANLLPSIKGGCALANRANRFSEKTSEETPGPGAYEVQQIQTTRSPNHETNKYSRQGIRFSRKVLPPSIPDPKSANGFEEDDLGLLIAQPPPVQDKGLGPAFYQGTTSIENDPSKLYHGVHFSKYSSKRTDFSGRTGPGPGDYDPNDSFKLEVHHMNMKSSDKRPELQIDRYPENMLKVVAKDSVPGPGQYSIKRELDPDASKPEPTGFEVERPAFGSQSKRFETLIPENPGPASYNDKVLTAFNDIQSKTSSFKRNPFNQTSARFLSPSQKARNVPGPTRYHLPSFTEENLRRAVIESGRKPPFNVASVRRFTMIRKDVPNMPGPSTYDVISEPSKPIVERPTANFLSSSLREFTIEDIPGPTAYDVSHAYQALNSQPRQPPRSKQARHRHNQFLSAAKRTFAGDVASDTPGPGAYDGFLTVRPHGFASMRDTRFHSDHSKQPGPADYELSPLLEDTVLRGTFNATLNNPIMDKLQNRALRDEEAFDAAANAKGRTTVLI